MNATLQSLIKDINNVDIDDILSCWRWHIPDIKSVVIISRLGDLFLTGEDDAIYWLQTDNGSLLKIAESLDEFLLLLNNEQKIDDWFFPELIDLLLQSGKSLKENEVYSYKVLPAIGGEYSVENLEPVDMSVHFAFSGQICEQIKDLPPGTPVRISFEK